MIKLNHLKKQLEKKMMSSKNTKRGMITLETNQLSMELLTRLNLQKNLKKKINFTDEVLKEYFLTTKEKLLIVLNNSGVESFEPKENTSSLDDHSCEVDVVTEITNDQNKNNFIVSTLRRGYKIKTTENQVIYIKKALVKVYEYQKKEDNIIKSET